MKILFVCTANVDRSKTAQDFFAEQFIQHEFKSAGTNIEMCREKLTTPIDQYLVDWADVIFAMEQNHKNWIESNLNSKGKKIEVLGIEDQYSYYSIPLIELLQQKLNSVLDK